MGELVNKEHFGYRAGSLAIVMSHVQESDFPLSCCCKPAQQNVSTIKKNTFYDELDFLYIEKCSLQDLFFRYQKGGSQVPKEGVTSKK